MRYNITNLTTEDYPAIEKLAQITEIDEKVDYNCNFWGAFGDKDRILYGVIGINFKKDKYPQFEHIVLRPERQKTKLAIILLRYIEKMLRDSGYKEVVAYVKNTKNYMQMYAIKFKFSPYSQTDDGIWFHKSLEKQEAVKCY